MIRLITKDKTYSFYMDQGTKTISKKPGETGYVFVADYSAPLQENDFVTLSDEADYTVKKAAKDDVVIGRIARIPKPKINEDIVECQVEIYGEMYELALKNSNAAIKASEPVKVATTGADKGTSDSVFIALEARGASDDKEVIDCFLALGVVLE
jgi:hypothetical protein